MSVDFGFMNDDATLVTAGFDRTFKLWHPNALAGYE